MTKRSLGLAIATFTLTLLCSTGLSAQTWSGGGGGGAEAFLTDTTANVRIGPVVTSPASPLMVNRPSTIAADISSTSGNVYGLFGAYGDFGGFRIGSVSQHGLYFITNNSARMTIDASGNVGIGTSAPSKKLDVQGDINVSGNINAKYQDFAEWVPVRSELAPGTVVVLDPERENEVMASTTAYDTAVAGVVSARPGIVLGEPGADKAKIATTGRVLVHVDATRHPIKIGDLLVSGERPGTAMWSQPIEVNGHRIHQPGTVIGKALQPLAVGEGEILVLLSLQ